MPGPRGLLHHAATGGLGVLGTPLEELTQGYYDLVSAGIKAKDAQNVLTQANKLAIGGLASTAETA